MSFFGEAVVPGRLGVAFRWLLGSQWVTNLGDGIALTAAPLLVAAQTRDPLLIAAAALVQRLPTILFGLYAGAIADRLDRRSIVAVTNILRTVVLVGLVAVILTDAINVVVVLIVLFALGTAEVFADVTAGALLPMLVDERDLGIANSRLVFGIVTLNQLAGPALGAVLFAVGMALPFGVQAVAMAFGAVLVSRIVVSTTGETLSPLSDSGDAGGARQEIIEGFRWLWRNREMRTLALSIVGFNVPSPPRNRCSCCCPSSASVWAMLVSASL